LRLRSSSWAITFRESFPIQLDRALVLGEGVVKCDFILRQALVFASSPRGAHFFGQIDELLQHLNCADGVRVISSYGHSRRSEKRIVSTTLVLVRERIRRNIQKLEGEEFHAARS
jgi:hypothetical protein